MHYNTIQENWKFKNSGEERRKHLRLLSLEWIVPRAGYLKHRRGGEVKKGKQQLYEDAFLAVTQSVSNHTHYMSSLFIAGNL